jgi:hypothetical protein
MPELPDARKETFAHYVAQGFSKTEAARRAGYKGANNSGSRVAQLPHVAARIEELRQADGALVCSSGIRSSPARVTAMEQRWVGMRTIIAERAKDPEMQEVPGGKTGLLTVDYKLLGSGENAIIKRIYKVDTPLLYELRAHEEAVAMELGQRIKRSESTTSSVNLTLTGDKELNGLLRAKLGELAPADRDRILEIAPSLADVELDPLIEQAPEKPHRANGEQ